MVRVCKKSRQVTAQNFEIFFRRLHFRCVARATFDRNLTHSADACFLVMVYVGYLSAQLKTLSSLLKRSQCEAPDHFLSVQPVFTHREIVQESRQAKQGLSSLVKNAHCITSSVTSAMLVMSETPVATSSYALIDTEARQDVVSAQAP